MQDGSSYKSTRWERLPCSQKTRFSSHFYAIRFPTLSRRLTGGCMLSSNQWKITRRSALCGIWVFWSPAWWGWIKARLLAPWITRGLASRLCCWDGPCLPAWASGRSPPNAGIKPPILGRRETATYFVTRILNGGFEVGVFSVPSLKSNYKSGRKCFFDPVQAKGNGWSSMGVRLSNCTL